MQQQQQQQQPTIKYNYVNWKKKTKKLKSQNSPGGNVWFLVYFK